MILKCIENKLNYNISIAYLKEYIDEADCYDLQMITEGYIKVSIFSEMTIDRLKLSEHCIGCEYHMFS